MDIKYIGIDLAKNVFQQCGLSARDKVVFEKRVQRRNLIETVAQIPQCIIGLEACTGAFYWQREFEQLGRRVRVISPQYVKPFVKGQKNDSNDAQAIAIALMQPTMQFVPPKNKEQQDILHCTVVDSALSITEPQPFVRYAACSWIAAFP